MGKEKVFFRDCWVTQTLWAANTKRRGGKNSGGYGMGGQIKSRNANCSDESQTNFRYCFDLTWDWPRRLQFLRGRLRIAHYSWHRESLENWPAWLQKNVEQAFLSPSGGLSGFVVGSVWIGWCIRQRVRSNYKTVPSKLYKLQIFYGFFLNYNRVVEFFLWKLLKLRN